MNTNDQNKADRRNLLYALVESFEDFTVGSYSN